MTPKRLCKLAALFKHLQQDNKICLVKSSVKYNSQVQIAGKSK